MSDDKKQINTNAALCDMYHIVGTLQGYATGIDLINANEKMNNLRDGLTDCADRLMECIVHIREENC